MKSVLRVMSSKAYGAHAALRNCAIALAMCVSAPVAAEELTLVALGDSLTQGYGLPAEDGFVPQLQHWLAENGAEVTIINAGVSGDTTAGGLARLDWTLTPEVDAILVTLGGNDLLRGIDPANSRANLASILETTQTRGIPTLLIGMQAPGNYGPQYKIAFDRIYPELATQYGAALIGNFFAPLLEGNNDPAALRPYMQPDGLHPNAEGVKKIVSGLGPSVLALLRNNL